MLVWLLDLHFSKMKKKISVEKKWNSTHFTHQSLFEGVGDYCGEKKFCRSRGRCTKSDKVTQRQLEVKIVKMEKKFTRHMYQDVCHFGICTVSCRFSNY